MPRMDSCQSGSKAGSHRRPRVPGARMSNWGPICFVITLLHDIVCGTSRWKRWMSLWFLRPITPEMSSVERQRLLSLPEHSSFHTALLEKFVTGIGAVDAQNRLS